MCGVSTVRCFHVYKQFSKNISSSGFIIKTSIRIYSKIRKKWKGKKSKAIVTSTRSRFIKPDGAQIYGFKNNCGLLKKRLSLRGKYIRGYSFYNLKKKKFLSSFASVLTMFKQLYNNLINLNINYKTNVTTNLFFFLKKSNFLKNYSNYLNFYISIFNQLKLKTVLTTYSFFSLDSLLPILNSILICWVLVEVIIL